MADIFNMADTWNAGGTTFTSIKMSVTDTASAAGSLLMDLQVGGTTQFSVGKGGVISAVNRYVISNGNGGAVTTTGLSVSSGSTIAFGSTSALSTADVILARDAANTLAQRNGTAAQAKRLYGTYTDASNYRRVALAMTTAGVATLAPEGAGTGASGNVLHISGLPTSNPGAGILWNNAGTPAIGT